MSFILKFYKLYYKFTTMTNDYRISYIETHDQHQQV